MTKDLKILYTVFILLVILPFLAFVFPAENIRWVITVFIAVAAVIIRTVVKKRSILSIYSRQVLVLMAVVGLVCVVLYFLSGIFFGLGRTSWSFSKNLFSHILPFTLMIISMESIRGVALAQDKKAIAVLCFIAGVTVETLCLAEIADMGTFYRVMDVISLTFLPAVASNALYHHIAKRYGALPNIVYKLLIALYPYFFRMGSLIPHSLLSFARLLIPILVLMFISSLYGNKKKYAIKNKVSSKIGAVVFTAVPLLLMLSIVMLISCQFRYCAIVIATESMSGELEKGDVVIYERFDGAYVEEGTIIVFKSGSSQMVHRVIDVQTVNGVTRYFTKGDANQETDAGFVTASDIIGIVRAKAPYVGYPTLWLRDTVTSALRGN